LQLRRRASFQPIPEDEATLATPARDNDRWHEAFCVAARECLCELTDQEWLILGLRLRHRLSQRAVAALLGVHEGNVSRRTSQLRDRCLGGIRRRLTAQGWTGEDLSEFIRTEMVAVLRDDPRFEGIGEPTGIAG
jgi:DNA-directed RNA polymerase specialized sigma24 family protein